MESYQIKYICNVSLIGFRWRLKLFSLSIWFLNISDFIQKTFKNVLHFFFLKMAAQAVKMISDLKFLHAVVVILKN